MSGHLLDLSTLVSRPTIAIDGEPYELRTWDEMGLIELATLEHCRGQIEELTAKAAKGDEEAAREVRRLTDKFLGVAFVALPADVRDRLSDQQRGRIMEVFMRLSPHEDAPTAGGAEPRNRAERRAMEAAGRKTPALSSPTSNASTAGRLTAG